MYKLGLNFEHIKVASKENNVSVFEVLKKIKMYGVSSLDVNVCDVMDNTNYRADVLRSGLSIDCVFYKGDYGYSDNIGYELSMIDFCAEHNIKNIMLLTEFIKSGDNELEYNTLLKKNLRRIVKYASNFNIKVGIENFGKEFSPFSTIDKCLDVLKSVKGLGLIYDSGNFLLAGENPIDAVKTLMPYIQRVHIKDRTYTEVEGSPMQISIDGKKTYTTTLGQGDCFIKEVVNLVKDSYERIDFVMEFDFTKLNITNNILDSATYYSTEID